MWQCLSRGSVRSVFRVSSSFFLVFSFADYSFMLHSLVSCEKMRKT